MDFPHKTNEIPTDERDKKEKTTNENTSRTRSYDCAFCKRGFTNAQALGGHMNIHRKDKVQAKKLRETSVAHKACEYFAPMSGEQSQFYASLRANKSYHVFASSPYPNFTHVYNPQKVSNADSLTPYRDFMGSSLNLRIGLPFTEERSREEIKKDENGDNNWLGNEQVDLELRLGQNA